MSQGGFLARWSRTKQQARRAARPSIGDSAAGSPAGVMPEGGVRPGDRGEISVEELAELPPVDELSAGSDLTQFLRHGVPAALRNAALRRVWALDPAIRDHIGDARDYAYDWNTPGGVPAAGALAEEDVPDLLRRVVGGQGGGPPPAAPDASPSQAGRPAVEDAAGAASDVPGPRSAETESGCDRLGPSAVSSPDADQPVIPKPRRHGGAMPV